MDVIILDGDKFRTLDSLHKILKERLDLPDYYGENLNALWDSLTGWIERPVTIIWRDFEKSKSYLGYNADEVLEVFKEAQDELGDLIIKVE
ncbi:barstar family protein [Bacillus haynesii]|uniref:barstar family protein n=1 Tax=Bacillus haynesii TaxID=1925021 RepID=UPI00228274C0|nr:barstar family protein [Bacillus haynesii]MCY9288533.1 barstar family protein [Bacillus haynesii]